jgi:hypothetical protein
MKIRCMKNYYDYFTINKIYEVINDEVRCDRGIKFSFYGDLKQFNKHMCSQFELVEEEKTMFKVGDKIKLISLKNEFAGGYKERLGKTGIIRYISLNTAGGHSADVEWDDKKGTVHNPYLKNLELVKEEKMKLSDIKERWLVVFANGEEAVRGMGSFFGRRTEAFLIIENGKETGRQIFICNYNEDLTNREDSQLSIKKVLKPRYEEVWTRPEIEEVEITFNELVKNYEESKKCKVKIVKESK